MVASGLGEWTALRDIMARHDAESALVDADGNATSEGQEGRLVKLGLGRIVALRHRASTLYQL